MGRGTGTDESVCRQALLPENAARAIPMEVVIFARHQQKAMFRLVHVPEKRARAPSLNEA